jgi:hypothetical protein
VEGPKFCFHLVITFAFFSLSCGCVHGLRAYGSTPKITRSKKRKNWCCFSLPSTSVYKRYTSPAFVLLKSPQGALVLLNSKKCDEYPKHKSRVSSISISRFKKCKRQGLCFRCSMSLTTRAAAIKSFLSWLLALVFCELDDEGSCDRVLLLLLPFKKFNVRYQRTHLEPSAARWS